MTTLLSDLRFALRSLSKTPSIAFIAILTLGLGIGATTTVFSCVNALFLRPFPYAQPQQLMALRQDHKARGWTGNTVSYPNFIDWQQQAKSFTAVAAHSGRSFNMFGGAEPERVEGQAISWNMFSLLGIAPRFGRDFSEADGRPGAAPVVLLSAALWERRFGSDTTIVGRAITLNGNPYTVVGVMPAPYQFPEDAQLWVALNDSPTERRGWNFLNVIGRLRDDVTVQQADAELAGIFTRMAAQYPEDNGGGWSASVVTLREDKVGEYKSVLQVMMGAVMFVLLIACANVANLLLSRAAARHREMAIRTALGAGRLRIVRQLLTESVLLALGGAALGIVIALWGLDLIAAAVPSDKPFWMLFTIDGRVLAFTAAIAVGTGVLFGLAPAWQVARGDVHGALKEGSRGTGTGGARQRLRHALVVAEMALSIILLVGAALMIQSFMRLQRVDPGFDRQNVLASTVVLSGSRYDSARARATFFEELLPRLRGLPGVTDVAASQAPPLSGSSSSSTFTVEGQPVKSGEEPEGNWQTVTAGYLTFLHVPLRGRDLSERDVRDSSQVAVINETMAQRFWPGQDALGKRFRFGGVDETDGSWMTVVGVARDVRHGRLSDRPENQFYIPYTQAPFRGMIVMVRTAGDPALMAPVMRREFRAVDPQLPVFRLQTMEAAFRSAVWEQRLYGSMFGVFAAVALVLAAVGLYGVMAYMVTLRTHEIGVRMALGAQRSDMLRMVVRQGIRLTALGVAIGLVGAFAVTGTLKNFLYGVTPSDPATFFGIPLILALVALLASWIPARRATRVDPMLALRYE